MCSANDGTSSAGKDLYDAGKCLLGGKCPEPPKVTINTLEGSASQTFSYGVRFTEGVFFKDSKATVLSSNCGLDVTSMKIDGKVKIIPA